MKRFLAGDIGGTKVIMALFEEENGRLRITAEQTYPSANYASFNEIIRDFRAQHAEPVSATGFGVAGPVFDRRCQATNLPWVIDARELETTMPVGRVALVNDFKAAALGVLHLQPEEWVDLNPGAGAEHHGPIAILGAGTGLGEALLVYAAGAYQVVPSEGGHTDFAPRNEDEMGLLRFLMQRHGRVSYERVLSGMGLHAIYDYLVATGFAPESPEVRTAMENADPASVVSKFAQGGRDKLCAKALDMFCAVYGAEAGNLALKIIASGGVYVTGGIAPKNIEKLKDGTFLEAYRTKGRFSNLVGAFPVRVVMNRNVGLFGAAAAAIELESFSG
ncbi:MAG TPA: glucokinase [Oscillatoriaceae cyanobacterium]